MEANISELVGKTLVSLDVINGDQLVFTCESGEKYRLHHPQDCCESVGIDDICGDLGDLVGSPILTAEEVTNGEFVSDFENSFKIKDEYETMRNESGDLKPESCTWTFYKFATLKGYVDVRWYGESNGYYSESVSFQKADELGEFSYY